MLSSTVDTCAGFESTLVSPSLPCAVLSACWSALRLPGSCPNQVLAQHVLFRYWKGTKAWKTLFPCQLDEKVKSCTFLRTLLQANYYGVKVELRSHLRALRAAQQYAGSGSMKYNSLSHDREDHVSVTKCRGEERALRLSCFMVVQKVPRDAHLHLVRTPPSCNLDALLYGRHRGLSRWCLGPLPSLRDCAASDQGPSHRAATCTIVAARRPPML